jgi:hypothetical protein
MRGGLWGLRFGAGGKRGGRSARGQTVLEWCGKSVGPWTEDATHRAVDHLANFQENAVAVSGGAVLHGGDVAAVIHVELKQAKGEGDGGGGGGEE